MKLGQKNYRRGIIISLGISIITVLILLLYTIDEETFEYLGQLKPAYLYLALMVTISMWLIEALRIWIIAHALKDDLSYKSSLMVFLAGSFASNITPFTSGGGPLQIYLIHREGVSLTNSTVNVMIRFVLRLVFFAVMGPLSYFLFRHKISAAGIEGVGQAFFNLFLVVSILVTVGTTIVFLKPQILTFIIKYLFSIPILKKLYSTERIKKGVSRLQEETEKFHECIWLMAETKKIVLIFTVILTALYWILFFSIIPILLAGLGISFNLVYTYVLQFIFYLVLPFMPTPGGSGFAEVGIVSLFSIFVPSGMLGVLAVLWRFFSYYMIMGFGGVYILKRLKEKISQ